LRCRESQPQKINYIKGENLEHYFIEKEHKKEDYFEISQIINGKTYFFRSCNDVFSKDSVDYGSYVLINTVLKTENLCGRVLDIGCGYGVIGIVLADNFKNATFVLSDVNGTAVELSKNNAKLNKITNIESIVNSFAYANIDGTFDYIISNPPIKAGKKVLLEILLNSHEKLNPNGSLIFVIKKKFGEDSIKKQLATIFKSVEVIKRDSGYYILKATK
jgi:16S rRNA (guanine1207-N2)-methyltransferase